MTALEETVLLPATAFGIAWDMLDLGAPHPVFGIDRYFWPDDAGKRQLHTATLELLTRLHLAHDRTLDPRWRTTLHVLGNAERECFGWSQLRDGTRRSALAALRGADAVLATVHDDLVELHPIPTARLATALFDTLPEVPGAAIRPVVVDRPSEETPDLFEDSHDRDHLSAVLTRPQEAVHQLYAARRVRGRRITGGPITAVDLDIGRVLTYRNSDDRIELIPGHPRAVVKVLNDTYAVL
ncbi:ESX secretion-associated protein EspG [Amycolatopsis ultiminotia]|uniref:ESX secretion-associated protein EspG n=1 Tax=Amycolatopsis ultiminotia TaxID=543629 RepID=A0ABP6YMD4_9PSEU